MYEVGHPPLEPEELDRYARQMILPGFGKDGQEKLKASRVLVAGVGGLGSLSSLYLCAAGIGHLTLVDKGRVQLPDLNRQLLYGERDVGEVKVVAAGKKLRELNSKIEITPVLREITQETVSEVMDDVQVVVDGTDNFKTRLILNKVCHSKKIPFVYGGIFGLKGTAATIIPGKTPCLECFLTRDEETRFPIPAIGPVVGVIASIQAMEVLKLILQQGNLLAGELALFDGGRMSFMKVALKRKEGCRICSI